MIKIAPNGQWTLAKSAEDGGPPPTTLHGLVGKTHTVEVHPHIDHLYRLKNHIQQQPKKSMQLGHIKKSEFGYLADKLPRDSKGAVTPEMIDKHIAGLPKHKVEVKVTPYEMKAQQHREDIPQYVASVGFHPDTLKKMPPKEREAWEDLKHIQHDLDGHKHQIGWARIDPYKIGTEGGTDLDDYEMKAMKHLHAITTDPANRADIQAEMDKHRSSKSQKKIVPNEGHWHVDEIQSDFGTPKKMDEIIRAHSDPEEIAWQIHAQAQNLHDQGGDDGIGGQNFYAKWPGISREDFQDFAEKSSTYYNAADKIMDQISKETDNDKRSELWAQISDNNKRRDAMLAPWHAKTKEEAQRIAEERKKNKPDKDKLHELMSHGHEDPMHMIHSAVNQLGRQNGIQSMSMDTPYHQAHQSGLRPSNMSEAQGLREHANQQVMEHIFNNGVNDEKANELWDKYGQYAINNNNHDIHFKSAAEKLGPEGLRAWADLVSKDNSSWIFNGSQEMDETLADNGSYDDNGEHIKRLREGGHEPYVLSDEVRNKLKNMTDAEKDALSRFANSYDSDVKAHLGEELGLINPDDDGDYSNLNPDDAEYEDLPVHQVNTYDKRPKKLGFQTVDKKSVLGEHPNESYNQVQYAKLYKKLLLIQELLRKADD